MLIEILDNILEQLAPKNQCSPYAPDVRRTLIACSSVCRGTRQLAAERLFHTLHITSSTASHRLGVLWSILEPLSQKWMSIRPFIRNFIFSIDSSNLAGTGLTVFQPFAPHSFVSLFNALAVVDGNHPSRITRFEFRVSPKYAPIFNQAFEESLLRLMRLPTLRSLEIHGQFLAQDFLLGTSVDDLAISGYGIDLNLECNDLYTEELVEVTYAQSNYPRLRKCKTDLSWPRGSPAHALDLLLQNLTTLSVEINISHAFGKAERLIRETVATLTTLIITYNFDGYEAELPTVWSIDFGEIQSLESLEFIWKNSVSSSHQNSIVKGCRPLVGILSLLDTIRIPMRQLTTVRWNFSYLATSLPPDTLSKWLQSDLRWCKLDDILSSAMFPSLHFVSLLFSPIALFSYHLVLNSDDEGIPLSNLVPIEFGIVEAIVSNNRQRVFPRLTASLGENFRFDAESQTVFTKGETISN